MPTIDLYCHDLVDGADWLNPSRALAGVANCTSHAPSYSSGFWVGTNLRDLADNQIPAGAILDSVEVVMKSIENLQLSDGIICWFSHLNGLYGWTWTATVVDSSHSGSNCAGTTEHTSGNVLPILGGLNADDLRDSSHYEFKFMKVWTFGSGTAQVDYVLLRVTYHLPSVATGHVTGNTFLLAVLAILARMQDLKKRRRKKLISIVTATK